MSSNQPRLSSLIGSIAPSATLAVDAKAKALKAAGEPVIGFGAGEPDFPTPPAIVAAAVDACNDPTTHKYSPVAGQPILREAIAAKTLRDSGLDVDPSQVLVTNGGKHAIYNAMMALLNPGDEVLLPAPYWTTYPESISLTGATPVVIDTNETSGFCVTVAQLEAARTPRTKALVFVSPSNPTGAVYNPAVVKQIGEWAVEHGIWVLTDEIYEHLTFGDAEFASMPVLVPELKDTCIVLNGVAKTYAMTGWRVGWMIAPEDITKGAVNFQSHATSNVCNVAQRAALCAVSGSLDAVAEMRETFDRRRIIIHEMLSGIEGFTCVEPQGAFYAFPSVQGLFGQTLGGKLIESSVDFAEVVLSEVNVAVVPGESFGSPGHLRFSYAMADDDMTQGVQRIADFVQSS